MKTIRLLLMVLLAAILLLSPGSALAQNYSFSLDRMTVHVFYNEDGTASIDYVMVFSNDLGASPIDYIDLGLPNTSFNDSSIRAEVDGSQIYDISRSGYQGDGTGVALGLGSDAIQPGRSGAVHTFIGEVDRMLYPDTTGDNYASTVFSPTWFGSQFVHGETDLSVTFHMPPGVQPDEPRWHAAPGGWSQEPVTGIDEQGRVAYTWSNSRASGSQQYKFGASFPAAYVPAAAIVQPSIWERLGIDPEALMPFAFFCCFGVFIVGSVAGSIRSANKRKLQYLPPKIAIEGMGIKRGLTAIEAAVLMEQPLDKVLTMMLFSTIKKEAASVVKSEPLELEIADPLPEGLNAYEIDFLKAFQEKKIAARRTELQKMMIALVKSVSAKMKGFSRKESLAYYKDIMERAWKQVEDANTPEVKSEAYDKVMEWTMLDKDYDDRTRRVFGGGPVFVPHWWGRYDPGFGRGTISSTPVSSPGGSGGGGISMPNLPGSDFAASVVNGVQGFSAGVVGDLSTFTSGVTNKTNPVPVSTGGSRSGSGGSGCACACACAGCACACAGGGR